ncbi:hypothetical protein CF392_16220, partial [Tamilnaduibacter salinus]
QDELRRRTRFRQWRLRHQSPGSPQGVTAKGGKVEPEALATTDQRPKGDPSATIDRLKAAAADRGGQCVGVQSG